MTIKPWMSLILGLIEPERPQLFALEFKKKNAIFDFVYSPSSTIFSSTGHRPVSLCHGPSCIRPCVCPSVRPSVRTLTFSLNIFFSETTYRILMKFHRNVPTMVLFRIFLNNLIPSKTLVAMATKLKIF